jgi:hypothetical protein
MVIDGLGSNVPVELTELITRGRILERRSADVLAYFTRPGTSNGPTEAIWPTRAPARQRPRVPQYHQLHREITARDRRFQAAVKSPIGRA